MGRFSELSDSLIEAGSIRINEMVYDLQRRGKKVCVLSLGEAFFDIPLFEFRALDFEKGYHYSSSRGTPELRRRISSFYEREYGASVDPETQTLASAGSKLLLHMAFQALLNPGDEVLVPEPYWVSYPEQIKISRGETKGIPYWENVKNYHHYLSEKTKGLIINNPNNPSGRVYNPVELELLYQQCVQNDTFLIVDEAYSDFCLDNSFFTSARLDQGLKNLVVVNSLSKNMGMSGWRLGYAFSEPEMINRMMKFNQHLLTCPSTVLSLYVETYFDDLLEVTLPQVKRVVEKREKVAEVLDRLGIDRMPGESTFYFMINIERSGKKSEDFALWLLENHKIATVPGGFYGDSCDEFVRIGVGTEGLEDIQNALQVIRDSFL